MQLPELELTLGEELLKPTRIYVKPVLEVIDKYNVKGIAHITGGGLLENIPRTLPDGLQAVIEEGSWPRPEVFRLIEEQGVEKKEMYRTFNQGIGMVMIINQEELEPIQSCLEEMGEESYLIGQVQRKAGDKECVINFA